MNRFVIVSALLLSACSQESEGIRIAHEAPAPPQIAAVPAARVEPVFFNGKTYKLGLTPDGQGGYAISVAGMSAKQDKDASELTKTAFHHFTCKDSQVVKLNAGPSFDGTNWNSVGRCA
jgi:hypothetical protein